MVSDQLRVWLYGQNVAVILQRDRRLHLRYLTEGRDVSTSMSSLVADHPHGKVAPWLDGLLPDNEAVLQRWAREMQVAPTAFSLLASPIGLDCAGAVQFTPGDVELPTERDSGVDWLDEDELAQVGAALYRDRTAWGEARRSGRFSLAGAQSKVALRFENGRFGEPYGDEATNVIVKPSLPGFPDHVVNEHLCMEAARRCGLLAAESRVVDFGEHRMFVTRRFDRRQGGGSLLRVHQEDMCQALGVPPGGKYQSDGGPSPRQIVERLREVVEPLDAERDVRRFLEALLFNWLVIGTDAHAKNYSILLPPQGSPRLAPLYDLASMAPHEDPLACKLAMKLGGEYRIKAISPARNVVKAARSLGVDADWAVRRAVELAERLPDALGAAAAEAGLEGDPIALQLRSAVAAHVRRRFPGDQASLPP